MNRNAVDIVWGIVIIVLGLIPIIYYKHLASYTADFNYKFLHFRGSEKLNQLIFLVGGLLIVILGLLTMLHITRVK